MKKLLVAALLLASCPAYAQYGGPPMWDRNYRDWGWQERERRLPEPRRYGPQMEPCIYYGDCRGPRPVYRMPPFRYPPPRYED
jgi:hypothetical protein